MRRRNQSIPKKANRVLNIILIAFVLIALRLWHLTVLHHDEKLEESRRPQKKAVIEPAKRGTIRDRFNLPLAINKLQYRAAVTYAEISQIPSVVWKYRGKEKIKRYARREHVVLLSKILGEALDLDASRIEDLIYSRASFFYHIPYVIKENLTEEQYYKLKILEKDIPGLTLLKSSVRNYPKGKLASDIIGYMGSIGKEDYHLFLNEVKELKKVIKECENGVHDDLPEGVHSLEEAHLRLKQLQELAYTVNDFVGKAGIEGKYEKKLRGRIGKKYYHCDAKGNFLSELSESTQEVPGNRVLLTISSELQEYAEKLLIQNESVRPLRAFSPDGVQRVAVTEKEPWIKGGAIIALDPNNGEVLALASYPRVDPNDFVASLNERKRVHQWFETEQCVGEIWEQKRALYRERYDPLLKAVVDEWMTLDWRRYLQIILSKNCALEKVMADMKTLGRAMDVSIAAEKLLNLADVPQILPILNFIYSREPHQPYQKKVRAAIKEKIEENLLVNDNEFLTIKASLDPYFSKLPNNYDKMLFIDLCRLIVDSSKVDDPAIRKIPIDDFLQMQADFLTIKESVYENARQTFSKNVFADWREKNLKSFLKQKRAEEKAQAKKYSTPYLDLLDGKEKELFSEFWEQQKWDLILESISSDEKWKQFSPDEKLSLLKAFRSFQELDRPLLGKYQQLKKQAGVSKEKHLAAAFYPKYGFGFGRSFGWRQETAPGSVFKLITAYQALVEQHQNKKSLNPLVIHDDYYQSGGNYYVGATCAGTPIAQNYKGGRIPRSHRAGLGKMDLLRAIETSSNPYFSLLACDVIAHPDDLIDAAKAFGFAEATGICLSGEKKGGVPTDLDLNPTGLYTTAVGQHTLLATPLQVAVMLSTLANGGKVMQPNIIQLTASHEGVKKIPSKIKREVFLPKEVQELLIEGMRRVASNIQQSPGGLSHIYKTQPSAIEDLIALKGQMIGKSSTAEAIETIDMDSIYGINRYNHLWYGGVFYEPNENGEVQFKKPELVVVAFCRYGAWGKDIAPLTAQIAQKWRQIKLKNAIAKD